MDCVISLGFVFCIFAIFFLYIYIGRFKIKFVFSNLRIFGGSGWSGFFLYGGEEGGLW